MGLQAKEPVWSSEGLTGLARELDADEGDAAALHRCLSGLCSWEPLVLPELVPSTL